jgi:hypothetical protein
MSTPAAAPPASTGEALAMLTSAMRYLAAAAARGMDLRDLATLAAEIASRACPGDDDPGTSFEDRAVRLETTFGGAGVLSGDLIPTAPRRPGTPARARSCAATAHPPAPGNPPGMCVMTAGGLRVWLAVPDVVCSTYKLTPTLYQ